MRLDSSVVAQQTHSSTIQTAPTLRHPVFFQPAQIADRFGKEPDAKSHSIQLIKNGKSTVVNGVVLAPGHKGTPKVLLEGTSIKHGDKVIGSLAGQAQSVHKTIPVLTESKNGHPYNVLAVTNKRGDVTHLIIGNGNSKISANGVTATLGQPSKVGAAYKAQQAVFSSKHVLTGPLKEAPVLALAGGDGTRAWPIVHERIGRGKAATSFYVEQQGRKTNPVSVWEEINRGLYIAGFKNVLTNTRQENADSLEPLVAKTNSWKTKTPPWVNQLATKDLSKDKLKNKDFSVKLVPEKISGGQGSLIYWASKDSNLAFKDKPVVLLATDAHIQLPWADIEKAYQTLEQANPEKAFVLSLYEPIPAEKVAKTYGSVAYGDNPTTVESTATDGHKIPLRKVERFKEKPEPGAELDEVSYTGQDGKPKADRRLLIEIMSPQAVKKFTDAFNAWTEENLGEGMSKKSQAAIEQAVLTKQQEAQTDDDKKRLKEPFDFTKDSILKRMVQDNEVDVYTYPTRDAWGDLGCPAKMRDIATVMETGEGDQDGIPFPKGLRVSGKVLPTITDKKRPGHMLVNTSPEVWKTLEKQGIKTEGNVTIVAAKGVKEPADNLLAQLLSLLNWLNPFSQ